LTPNQLKNTNVDFGCVYVTDDKCRLMAYIDMCAEPYGNEESYRIWHLCLENEDEYTNYGIYVNGGPNGIDGLLVESASRFSINKMDHLLPSPDE
jgi:hypothetical protein